MRTRSRALLAGFCALQTALLRCTQAAPEAAASSDDSQLSPALAPPAESDCLSLTHAITFISNRASLVEWQLYLMAIDGSDAIRIATGEFRAPAWSPDGRSIAFWRYSPDAEGRELGLIDPDGSEYVSLHADGSEPAPDLAETASFDGPSWSSDGALLAFASPEESGSRVWVIARSGGAARLLLPELGVEHGGPRWSRRDPALLAFVTRDGTGDIWVVDVRDPSSPRNVTQGRFLHPESPSWSPNDSHLAFSAQRVQGDDASREIYVLALDAADPPLQLTDNRAVDLQPAWSPDGRSLLITSDLARLDDDPRGRALAPVDLWIVPLDAAKTARALTRDRFDAKLGWVPQSGGHGMGDWAWNPGCEGR